MKISIQSLKNGLNIFEFDASVDDLDLPEEKNVDVEATNVRSKVDKSDHNIVVASDVKARLNLVCDRCLEKFNTCFQDEYTLVYTTDKSTLEGDEMVKYLAAGTQQIDLAEGLRESILLSLPISCKCSSECKGLCDHCGANLNNGPCGCHVVSHDSRWEGLRGLLQKDSDT